MDSKKKKLRIIAVTYACAGALVLGGLAYSAWHSARVYKTQLANTYQHAFAELVTSVGEMDTALEKCLYTTTPEMTSCVCTQLFGKSMSAQMAMGELPLSQYGLEETASFISRVGDYAYMMSKSTAAGNQVTQEQADNLQALSDAASDLSYNLKQLLAQVSSGTLTISELDSAQESAGISDENVSASLLGDSFQNIETEFPEIPTLIYDGPFSQHITQESPKAIEGLEEVSCEQALAAAAEFFGLRESVFEISGERSGNIPVYTFSAAVDGGTLICQVTKQGGIVYSALNSREVSAANISAEDGVKIAARFLEKQGYADMAESYWSVTENTVLVNFAWTSQDVVCYPDLVKVSVALDSGSVTGFECMGYLMSHTERDIPDCTVSEQDAQMLVSPRLAVLSHKLAIIPTDGKYEKFCHEFKCEAENGRHFIVYINAQTGSEEKLLILLEDESGTLTI